MTYLDYGLSEFEQQKELIDQTLNALHEATEHAEPAFQAMVPEIFQSIAENFRKGGRPEAWAPLAPRTQKDRERQGYGGPEPILYRTGELMTAAAGGGLITWFARPQDLIFSADATFEKFHHQTGFVTAIGAKVPARPFLLLQEEDQVMALQQVALHLAKAVQVAVR